MVATHKAPIVDKFTGMLQESKSAVVAEYQGLTHKQMQVLRKALREQGAEMKIVKNTLARRACVAVGFEPLAGELKGPLAFILSYQELTAGPKAILDFAKKHPKLKVRGGYTDGILLDAAGVKVLATLPGKTELRAQFLSILSGVQSQFLTILEAGPKEFLQTLGAREEQQGGA